MPVSLFDKFRPLEAVHASLAGEAPPALATPITPVSATEGIIGDKRVILAGTNNYLGMTFNPECKAAAIAAIDLQGTGTTGSRMANGSTADHMQLEQEIASAYGWPAAIVFSTGYQANLGVLSSLVGPDDYLVIDADSHSSIYDGCRLSHATTLRFRHNDPDSLDQRLARLGSRAGQALVVIEGLYSMLGDQPPLAELIEVKNRHGASLLLDEAHSFGVFGPRGLGIAEQAGLLDEVDFIVGTFSKSLGGIGGFCASPHPELELLRLASRPYIFTASPSPAVIAATRAALRVSVGGEALRKQLWHNIERLYREARDMGYVLGSPDPGPVAAILLPDRESALALWRQLLALGVYTNLMIPPATPNGLHLLRISLSAAHSDQQLDTIIAALGEARPPSINVVAAAATGAG